MQSDLAQIYARVVAVRPDLAVTKTTAIGDTYTLAYNLAQTWCWECGEILLYLDNASASALITIKWEDGLPHGTAVIQSEYGYGVARFGERARFDSAVWYGTRIEALAEYFAPTKGPHDEH